MHTTVSVGRMDPEVVREVAELFAAFDSAVSSGITGLKRRQLYTYYDVFIQIQDFVGNDAVEASRKAAEDPAALELARSLTPFVRRYDQAVGDDRATSFYHWEGGLPVEKEIGLHSTVIVNRIAAPVIQEVARLFGELDAGDFPYRMGTRRRQLFSYHGVYFHIQDFERENGNAVIDQAWRDADPRFVKICADLDPLVKKYDPDTWRSTSDQIATRFHLWEASA